MHYFKMTCIYIFSISIVLFILNIINYVLINGARSSCFTVLGVGTVTYLGSYDSEVRYYFQIKAL